MGAQIHCVHAAKLAEVGIRDMMLVGANILDFNAPLNAKKEIVGGQVLGAQNLAGDRLHWERLTVSWKPAELENARKTLTAYLKAATRYDDDEWFKDFFGEDLPTIIQYKDSETGTEVKGITSLLSLPPKSQILDLGCGYGRITIPLALPPHLFNLTAVDVSVPLIKQARELYTAEQMQSSNVGEVVWIPDDILDLQKRADFEGKFDAAISIFSSFGYYHKDNGGKDRNLETLRIAAYALKKDGKLLIDIDNPAPFIDAVERKPQYEPVRGQEGTHDHGEIVIHRHDAYDKNKGRRLSSFLLERKAPHNTVQQNNNLKSAWICKPLVSVQLYSYNELTDRLSEVGFKVVNVKGDWQLNIYSTRLSPRLIVLAQKERT